MSIQKGFFDEAFRLEELKQQGDPLVSLKEIIDWESFREPLRKIFKKVPKGAGGRPAYDYVMMFRILILQRLYNLSDNQMQFQLMDRISFMRFVDLDLNDKVPDEKTIWLFRETLTKSGELEKLFEQFHEYLLENGFIAQKGLIVDASFVEVPKQRNTREENKEIKENVRPEGWSENKERQKDTDARWTIKGGENHYGYKNHIKIDKESKIIETFVVTPASVHDSQALEELLREEDSHHELYADSAYAGKPVQEILKNFRIRNRIHEKGYRGLPLTEEQKERNRKKSRIRARVEHVFGFIHTSMKGHRIRSIGIVRARGIIALMNLVYNMIRYIRLCSV